MLTYFGYIKRVQAVTPIKENTEEGHQDIFALYHIGVQFTGYSKCRLIYSSAPILL